jgi:tRNA(Met) C34 N-acetyltransferase TmcA
MFIKPFSHQGEALHIQAREQFAKQLPALLSDSLSQLSADIVLPLLSEIQTQSLSELTHQDWIDVTAYAFANRGYEYTLATIHALTLHILSRGQADKPDSRLLIMRVLQKQSWGRCASTLGFSGRRSVERRLRQILQTAVLGFANESIRQLAETIRN